MKERPLAETSGPGRMETMVVWMETGQPPGQ